MMGFEEILNYKLNAHGGSNPGAVPPPNMINLEQIIRSLSYSAGVVRGGQALSTPSIIIPALLKKQDFPLKIVLFRYDVLIVTPHNQLR